MKEVTTQIRQHFIQTISPLEVNGQNIPVLNMASEKQQAPFVIVSTRASGSGTKCKRDWIVTTSIDIIFKTAGYWGGDKLTEEIANEIYQKIDSSRPTYATTDDFQLVTQLVEAADPILEQNSNGRVIRKTIIIENYVSQLNN